jgi:prefoldin subunit 5
MAAFINAIAEEGTKDEAVEWLQKTWDELQAAEKVMTTQATMIAELNLKVAGLESELNEYRPYKYLYENRSA